LSTFWQYLFYQPILVGAWLTLVLSVIAQGLGIIIGLFLALMRLSRTPFPALRWLSGLYVWFFRGIPLLVTLLFVYDGIPQATNQAIVLGSVTSAIIALSLNEGAYMAEIIRAGIMSVNPGQVDAAKALGMTYALTTRRVVIPQAIRFIIPPTGNEFISMLKNTSLAAVIATPELLYHTQLVYDANFEYFPLLTVAAVWYLLMTTIATYFQGKLEQRTEYRQLTARRRRFNVPGFRATHV